MSGTSTGFSTPFLLSERKGRTIRAVGNLSDLKHDNGKARTESKCHPALHPTLLSPSHLLLRGSQVRGGGELGGPALWCRGARSHSGTRSKQQEDQPAKPANSLWGQVLPRTVASAHESLEDTAGQTQVSQFLTVPGPATESPPDSLE